MSFLSIDLTTKALIRALQWHKLESENKAMRPHAERDVRAQASQQASQLISQQISNQESDQ